MRLENPSFAMARTAFTPLKPCFFSRGFDRMSFSQGPLESPFVLKSSKPLATLEF